MVYGMKKTLSITLLLSVLCSHVSFADTYRSALGFELSLPDQWLVLSRETISNAYDGKTLDELGLSKAFSNADDAAKARNKIEKGKVEYYFDTDKHSSGFVRSINLQIIQRIAGAADTTSGTSCPNIEEQLRNFHKDNLNVSHCEFNTTDDIHQLTYIYTKTNDSLTHYHHEYQITPNIVLLMVAITDTEGVTEFGVTQKLIISAIREFFSEYPMLSKVSNELYAQQKYTQAYDAAMKLATIGDQDGEYLLALMHEHNYIANSNHKTAHEYYLSAASKGNMLAVNNLGNLYFFGKGVSKDIAKSATLYKQAATTGLAVAQTNYAGLLFKGQGVDANPNKAVAWYLKAARQGDTQAGNFLNTLYLKEASSGNIEAWRMLAALYLEGAGVNKDIRTGLQYLQRAANSGSTSARELLVIIYTQGRFGVERNENLAQKWRQVIN
ncbi:hypothetical protein A9Q99_07060 [Gammaproteobacteria bacterium 45_16_T64]|nr:hypothetical protein A9Q99_07060 [Gammaproteobacteria bacterium 45_16_T64]